MADTHEMYTNSLRKPQICISTKRRGAGDRAKHKERRSSVLRRISISTVLSSTVSLKIKECRGRVLSFYNHHHGVPPDADDHLGFRGGRGFTRGIGGLLVRLALLFREALPDLRNLPQTVVKRQGLNLGTLVRLLHEDGVRARSLLDRRGFQPSGLLNEGSLLLLGKRLPQLRNSLQSLLHGKGLDLISGVRLRYKELVRAGSLLLGCGVGSLGLVHVGLLLLCREHLPLLCGSRYSLMDGKGQDLRLRVHRLDEHVIGGDLLRRLRSLRGLHGRLLFHCALGLGFGLGLGLRRARLLGRSGLLLGCLLRHRRRRSRFAIELARVVLPLLSHSGRKALPQLADCRDSFLGRELLNLCGFHGFLDVCRVGAYREAAKLDIQKAGGHPHGGEGLHWLWGDSGVGYSQIYRDRAGKRKQERKDNR
eukprot:RCo013296